MNLTVPPQGHRSIIDRPIRAAVPQVIGKPLESENDNCPVESRYNAVGENPR